MIDQTVESSSPLPAVAVIFGAVALFLGVFAVATGSLHWAIGALLPLAMALAIWLVPEPSFRGQFTAQGIELADQSVIIPYEDIEGLTAKGRPGDPLKAGPPHYPMQVIHAGGVLVIPARLNVPSDDVYRFLLSRFPACGSRAVNPTLADYLREQEATFGADRVWSYCARRHLGLRFPARKARAGSLAACLTGLAWIAVGIAGKQAFVGWIVAGSLTSLVAGFTFLIFWVQSRSPLVKMKNWREASLVISPVGLAMVQGTEKGKMRWDELRKIKLNVAGLFDADRNGPNRPGLIVHVAGADFAIKDIYDQPLPLILERIKQYWKPT